MAAQCPRCEKRGKTWEGGDPQCAFPHGHKFQANNWNCATVNAIRKYVDVWAKDHPLCFTTACDDERFATVDIYETHIGRALYLAWYKTRGRTDGMWIMDTDEEPRRPTYKELDAIILHLEAAIKETA